MWQFDADIAYTGTTILGRSDTSSFQLFIQARLVLCFSHSAHPRSLLVALISSWLLATSAYGQFTTVINVPPDPAPPAIEQGTQLNLSEGGVIGDDFDVGNRFIQNENAEVNISGGVVGNSFRMNNGSVVNVTGGRIGSYFRSFGSADAPDSSRLTISGGSIGDDFRFHAGTLDIYGGEFRKNGELIPGLENPGDSVQTNFLMGTVITGTLADGTPITFSRDDGDRISWETLTLHAAELPEITQSTITVPNDPVPLGVRGGQTLVLNEGGEVEDHFNAGWGSTVNIYGGVMGENLEAIRSEINITGGTVGERMDAFDGSTVNISGGTVGDAGLADGGSTLNISGGSVGSFQLTNGSEVNLTDGTIKSLSLYDASSAHIHGGTVQSIYSETGHVEITGGDINSVEVLGGVELNMQGGRINTQVVVRNSTANLSGGSTGRQFHTKSNSDLNISGADFRLDGMPISGLENLGDSHTFRLNNTQALSGTLADGTPFVFSRADENDIDGNIRLTVAETAAPGPSSIIVPNDPVPLGVRDGQTITVDAGGDLGDNFNAGRGSTVNINGGKAGVNFEAAGAVVNLSGGEIGPFGSIFAGTVLNMSGGITSQDFAAHSGTTLNISGGSIQDNFLLRTNSTMNFSGGELSDLYTESGSELNVTGGIVSREVRSSGALMISGGTLRQSLSINSGGTADISGGMFQDNLGTASGSEVNISGGYFAGSVGAGTGAVVNITGGNFNGGLGVATGSDLTIAGGAFADGLSAGTANSLEFSGNNFRIDGELVSGLNQPGNSVSVTVPAGAVLSGTLVDGTPFAFTSIEGDDISNGSPTLTAAEINPAPTTISVPNDPAPLGIHDGQILTLSEGGILPYNFTAGWGSTINITGGKVGRNFEAVGAQVNISGGLVDWNSDALFGSEINISGGRIGRGMDAHRGSIVNISGGEVGSTTGSLRAFDGSIINITGGTVGEDFEANAGSEIYISGGSIGAHFKANSFSDVFISGQTVLNGLEAYADSQVEISGGSSIYGLRAHANSVVEVTGGHFADEIIVQPDSMLTLSGGEFQIDNVPIAGLETVGNSVQVEIPNGKIFSGTLANGETFAFTTEEEARFYGPITLLATDLPAAPNTITVPGAPVPKGVRQGQTLILNSGAELGPNHVAAWNSTVDVNGGQIGDNFEALSAEINLTVGSIGDYFDAFQGTNVNISGGSMGAFAEAHPESKINMSGGSIGARFRAHPNSRITISGGSVGEDFRTDIDTMVIISGGSIDNGFHAYYDSTVVISGGTIGDSFTSNNNASVHIVGNDFRLNGELISGLSMSGDSRGLDLPDNAILTGTFEDGTPFLFTDLERDQFADGTLRLIVGNVQPGPAQINVPAETAPLGIHDSQTLNLAEGGSLGDHFAAGKGSTVNIEGGQVGENFEAFDAEVNISGGIFGDGFDAWGESEVNLFGTQFVLDGEDITDSLSLGDSTTIVHRDVPLKGFLADGSPFHFELSDGFGGCRCGQSPFLRSDYFSSEATLTLTLVEGIPGDFNGDWVVDGQDFLKWQRGETPNPFSQSDLSDWTVNQGLTAQTYSFDSLQVPEPATLVSLLILAQTLLLARRR